MVVPGWITPLSHTNSCAVAYSAEVRHSDSGSLVYIQPLFPEKQQVGAPFTPAQAVLLPLVDESVT